MFLTSHTDYLSSPVRLLLCVSLPSFHLRYGPSSSTPSPPQWSCPLAGFRLMTSDSPLKGASCLQSAVRLLVIIFQSVTLVSASWHWERERGMEARGHSVMFGVGQFCGIFFMFFSFCVCLCLDLSLPRPEHVACHCFIFSLFGCMQQNLHNASGTFTQTFPSF